MHLQKLGQLIVLLGGSIDFSARLQNGKKMLWTPEYLSIPEHAKKMIYADIDAEKSAIKQYRMHIKMIGDPCVTAVLFRIIQDEEYHIMILEHLLKDLQSELPYPASLSHTACYSQSNLSSPPQRL